MFGGEVDIITDMDIKSKIWLDWWIRYYPKGLEDSDYALLKLSTKTARFYYKLQHVKFEPGEK